MKVNEFLSGFDSDTRVEMLKASLAHVPTRVQISGLAGSRLSVLLAQLLANTTQFHCVIMPNREAAAYLCDDIESLFGQKPLYFPSSYRKQFVSTDIDNANVLQRAETLNHLTNADLRAMPLLITFAEALTDKVVNKRTLVENTLKLTIGDKLEADFITDVLFEYKFDSSDFVYEPGQFAVRGGIIDIYSFAAAKPIRIELDGSVIGSIRSFDPETQLSIASLSQATVLPNIEQKFEIESRQPFFDFLPQNTILWCYSANNILADLDKLEQRALQHYYKHVNPSQSVNIALKPSELYLSAKAFGQIAEKYNIVEFQGKSFKNYELNIEFGCKAQPSLNKDFDLLTNDLKQYHFNQYRTYIASDSPRQLERLQTILTELAGRPMFEPLYISLEAGFIDPELKILCYTDHQIFERHHKFKSADKVSKSKALTLKELKSLNTGDYVVHVDYGIGRFVGLETVEVNGKLQEAVRLIYKDDDSVLLSIHSLHKISKYSSNEGEVPSISKLGSGEWENKKRRAKKRLQDMARELIELYAKRKAASGFAYSHDGYLQAELESSFLYEDTPDQAKATADVKADMERPNPMDRLVCGDVGFGKTEVAVRAAFKAVNDSKQVAILTPTTLLTMQHFKTFSERLAKLPCKVDYISRFKNAVQVKESLQNLAEGKTDIIIGTHKLVSKEIKFKDLGLLIVDEEQKFGVKVKEKLKEFKVNVDVLTLTATPIPRTLQFSLMAARDLSIIATPPPNRQPVTTEVVIFSEEVIRDAIRYELDRGGQVFYVHNRIADLDHQADILKKLVPDAKIGRAHGQMNPEQLENVMLRFIDGEYDILVSTNIIEAGLDIPNANTIIINRAQMFGLADLHQMRGRVGRSNRKAYAYLVVPTSDLLTADARRRLKTLEEFSDLGDGINVAMRDLDIRGAGNLLGAEQSGFINDLGFEMYHKILNEAIMELKQTQFADLFKDEPVNLDGLFADCTIETDLEIRIPDSYIPNISERLRLYTELDETKSEAEIITFEQNLIDRFGPPPSQIEALFKTVRLRQTAQKIGIEKIVLKNKSFKAYFPSAENQAYYKSENFGYVLEFVKRHPKLLNLKDVKGKLIISSEQFYEPDKAHEIIKKMLKPNSIEA